MRTVTISIRPLLSLVLIQFIGSMAFGKTEEQKYRVVHSEAGLKSGLSSATLATVYSSAKSYKELSGPGFRKLAGYIFGDNSTDTKISMTSPVHMNINNSQSSMSFVMPSSYTAEKLPEPDDKDVKIEKTPDEYVAAIKFGGYASDEDIINYSEKLKKLDRKGDSLLGQLPVLGYDLLQAIRKAERDNCFS
jgi:hypothetical protein